MTKFKLLFLLEMFLYMSSLSIIFYIDWRYGIATVLMIIGDFVNAKREVLKNNLD